MKQTHVQRQSGRDRSSWQPTAALRRHGHRQLLRAALLHCSVQQCTAMHCSSPRVSRLGLSTRSFRGTWEQGRARPSPTCQTHCYRWFRCRCGRRWWRCHRCARCCAASRATHPGQHPAAWPPASPPSPCTAQRQLVHITFKVDKPVPSEACRAAALHCTAAAAGNCAAPSSTLGRTAPQPHPCPVLS